MTGPGDWQRSNDEFLAAALRWLRVRLEAQASARRTQQAETTSHRRRRRVANT
jgi:hypothetical protein